MQEDLDETKLARGRGEETPSSPPENKMGVMPVGRLLVSMALPMVLSMLVQALYNIVDSVFVGMISSENNYALTAVSLAFPLQNLMIAFATGTGVGINAFLSRSLGEKNRRAVDRAAGNGIFLILATSAAFTLFGALGSSWFLSTQSENPHIIADGIAYLRVILVFSLGLFLQVTMERLLQATGKTFLCMLSQMTGALVNIILDPIFILPAGARVFFFHLPFGLGMGTAGAAIATVIGQSAAAALGIFFNLKFNKEIGFSPKNLRPRAKIIGEIYKVGLPSIFMAAVGSFLTIALNKILTIAEEHTYGSAADQLGVTVYGIYFKLQSFVFMPVFGLNNGMVPIVAYNYGAGNKRRILRTVALALLFAVCYMTLGLLVFQLFPRALLRLFSVDERALEIGVTALRRISLCFLFAGVCVISISTLQALGQGVASLLISLARQVLIILPLSYLLAVTVGIDGVWYAFPAAEGVALVLSILVLARTYKKVVAPLGRQPRAAG